VADEKHPDHWHLLLACGFWDDYSIPGRILSPGNFKKAVGTSSHKEFATRTALCRIALLSCKAKPDIVIPVRKTVLFLYRVPKKQPQQGSNDNLRS
jgi:hypothetical protein